MLSRPTLLVISAPLKQGETSHIVSTLALNLLVQRLYHRFGGSHRRCFLFVNEAPRLVDRFPFEEVLLMWRSADVSIVLAARSIAHMTGHSIPQVTRRSGTQRARPLVGKLLARG